jgi:hypothetical protein
MQVVVVVLVVVVMVVLVDVVAVVLVDVGTVVLVGVATVVLVDAGTVVLVGAAMVVLVDAGTVVLVGAAMVVLVDAGTVVLVGAATVVLVDAGTVVLVGAAMVVLVDAAMVVLVVDGMMVVVVCAPMTSVASKRTAGAPFAFTRPRSMLHDGASMRALRRTRRAAPHVGHAALTTSLLFPRRRRAVVASHLLGIATCPSATMTASGPIVLAPTTNGVEPAGNTNRPPGQGSGFTAAAVLVTRAPTRKGTVRRSRPIRWSTGAAPAGASGVRCVGGNCKAQALYVDARMGWYVC